jgi:hypothetical protein
MSTWVTLDESVRDSGLPEPAIWKLVKSLQVGWRRDVDGVIYVDANDLEAHVPAKLPQCDEWLPPREARALIGSVQTAHTLWRLYGGHGDRRPIINDDPHQHYEYRRGWCEAMRELVSTSQESSRRELVSTSQESSRQARGPERMPRNAYRHFVRELRQWCGAHTKEDERKLAAIAGVSVTTVYDHRSGRRDTCSANTAKALRKAMREFSSSTLPMQLEAGAVAVAVAAPAPQPPEQSWLGRILTALRKR